MPALHAGTRSAAIHGPLHVPTWAIGIAGPVVARFAMNALAAFRAVLRAFAEPAGSGA